MPQVMQNWNGLHMLIVHILIILLLVVPLLVIVSFRFSAGMRRPFLGAALALMVLGTAMIYVAVASGHLATKSIVSDPGLSRLVSEHRAWAETTRDLFSMLTLVFVALFFADRVLMREVDSWLSTALLSVFLIFYGTGAVSLVYTAIKGGHIAHVLTTNTAVTSNLSNKGGH